MKEEKEWKKKRMEEARKDSKGGRKEGRKEGRKKDWKKAWRAKGKGLSEAFWKKKKTRHQKKKKNWTKKKWKSRRKKCKGEFGNSLKMREKCEKIEEKGERNVPCGK